jgi:hypothetical protein
MIKIVTLLFAGISLFTTAQDNANAEKAAKELKAVSKTAEGEDGWSKGGDFSVNFSQVALSNWAGGGQNSMSISGMLNLFANLKKNKNTWDNSLKLGYGMMKQGEAGFFKTDDKIDFSSKYGRQAFGKWYYSGLMNFRTQFDYGYTSPTDLTVISKLLAPGYLIAAAGMDYKPNKYFTMFVSPLTSKTTFVMDKGLSDAGAYGVDLGQRVRYEIGGYLKFGFKKDIVKNVNLESTLDLFSNYLNNPENIDVNWQVLIAMKVNKYLTTSIAMNLLYDDDIHTQINPTTVGPRVQFKEVLSIGLGVKF